MQQQNNQVRILLLYLFIISTLYTGVIRKWILPDLSTYLIILPQIFSILVCIFLRKNVVFSVWEKAFFYCGIVVFATTMIFGHQNIWVGVYGCLPYWFGLTTCCILGQSITKHDLVNVCKLIVITSIINSIVCIIQFYSPVGSFINADNVYIEHALDSEIAGFVPGFRGTGIFMHSSQIPIVYAISFTILLYNLFVNRFMNKWLCYATIAFEFISMPFFVSRTNVIVHVFIAIFFFGTCYSKKIKKKLLYGIPIAIIAITIIYSTDAGYQAVKAMSVRFSNAASSLYEGSTTTEGTLRDLFHRNITYNVKALVSPSTVDGRDVPFWGYGQGMSTQIGGRLLGIEENSGFALAEGDGLRIVCESGLLLGWIIIFIRLRYAFVYLFQIRELKDSGKLLALSLLPTFLLAFFLSANWGNIFQAHMSYLIAGIFLTSLNYKDKTDKEEEEEEALLRLKALEEIEGENVEDNETEDQHSVVWREDSLA